MARSGQLKEPWVGSTTAQSSRKRSVPIPVAAIVWRSLSLNRVIP